MAALWDRRLTRRRSEMTKHREGLLIEVVDERVLIGAGVGAERFGAVHQNFVRITGKD
jgi:hypothetical protein